MKAALSLLASLCCIAAARAEPAPQEPQSFQSDDRHGPVPATLNGQPALDVAQAKKLWESHAALFLDVLPHAPRPKGLAPDTVFVEKPHVSIKGAIWLPDVGRGALSAETENYFRRALATLSAADLAKKIVIFCKRDCWMSWNAARRAQSYGYTQIFWYSQGIEGWREADLPTAVIAPYLPDNVR